MTHPIQKPDCTSFRGSIRRAQEHYNKTIATGDVGMAVVMAVVEAAIASCESIGCIGGMIGG
ncbi:hypothetical protein IQ267_14245 [filamentous cyanobacterium LEGE 07170]|nr:hypothetical protein [filamentous cyanobacterium LEGE 07170]